MSDLLSGKELAIASERSRMWASLGLALGVVGGSRLAAIQPRLCYLVAAGCGAATMALMGLLLQESLPKDKRLPPKSGLELARSVNPLSFLRLFRSGSALRTLTLVQGFSLLGDGGYDLDEAFRADVVGWDPAQRGNFELGKLTTHPLDGGLKASVCCWFAVVCD